MYENIEAKDSEKKVQMAEALQRRIQAGAKQQATAIERAVEMSIVDRLVSPRELKFTVGTDGVAVSYGDALYQVSKHALGQMADTVDLPLKFANRLRNHKHEKLRDLLETNLDELFQYETFTEHGADGPKFLLRHVGNELRGFLSRKFNRKLGTTMMLRPFIEECALYRAQPVEAHTTDRRTALKCMLPVVFEPIPGEFVAFGVTYVNGDFGDISLRVVGTFLRIGSGTVGVTESGLNRAHIGPVIKESDLELSVETANKEAETVKSAIRDVVRSQLSPQNIEKALNGIRLAAEKEIPWSRIQAGLKRVLREEELDSIELLLSGGPSIVDLPPIDIGEDKKVNHWWLANVIGVMAANEKDADRKNELQAVAGGYVEV